MWPYPICVRVGVLFGEKRRPRVAEASHAAVVEIAEAISVATFLWCLSHRDRMSKTAHNVGMRACCCSALT